MKRKIIHLHFKVRKVAVRKAPVVETDSEEDFELSPVPAKNLNKARVITAKKPSKAGREGDSKDMFSFWACPSSSWGPASSS